MMAHKLLRRVGLVGILVGFVLVPSEARVADSLPATALAQKNLAMQLFAGDSKIRAALKVLQDSQYQLLSTDAIPYRFAYGDEGPIGNFLVTAWLGKREAYGWKAAFVCAKVNTDSFGPPSVKIVNSKEIQRFLE